MGTGEEGGTRVLEGANNPLGKSLELDRGPSTGSLEQKVPSTRTPDDTLSGKRIILVDDDLTGTLVPCANALALKGASPYLMGFKVGDQDSPLDRRTVYKAVVEHAPDVFVIDANLKRKDISGLGLLNWFYELLASNPSAVPLIRAEVMRYATERGLKASTPEDYQALWRARAVKPLTEAYYVLYSSMRGLTQHPETDSGLVIFKGRVGDRFRILEKPGAGQKGIGETLVEAIESLYPK